MANFFDRFKFPTSDAKTVGKFMGSGIKSFWERFKPPTKDIKTVFSRLKPPIKDIATIGQALPQAKSPFEAYKKMSYDPAKYVATDFIPKFGEGFAPKGKKDLPFGGTLFEAGDVGKLLLVDKKIKDKTASGSDKIWMNNYLKEAEAEEKKREKFGYRMGAGIKGSGIFMIELGAAALLAAPSGGSSIAGFGAAKLSQKKAKDIIKDFVTDKATRNLIADIGKKQIKRTGVEVAIVGGLHTPQGALERMVGTPEFKEGGEFIGLAEDGQDVGEAIINSATDNMVEVVSERTGGLFSLFGGSVKNSLVKAGILKATKNINKNLSEKQIASVFKTMGWNGVVSEYLEERTGDVMRGALYKVGLSDREFRLPTLAQSAEEIAMFSIMGSAIKTIGKSADYLKGVKPGLTIEDVSKPSDLDVLRRPKEVGIPDNINKILKSEDGLSVINNKLKESPQLKKIIEQEVKKGNIIKTKEYPFYNGTYRLATATKPTLIIDDALDKIFNVSGKYPEQGIEFVRPLKQLTMDGEMSVIGGGKIYSATKQQIRDAQKLLDAIRTNDESLAKEVYNRYPIKRKMITGSTRFVPHNNVVSKLQSASEAILFKMKKAKPIKPSDKTKPTLPKATDVLRQPKEVDIKSFIKKKGLDPDSVNIKDNKNFIVENTAGNEALLTEIPISKFGKPKFETAGKYKAGRKITDPIEATMIDGKLTITDGANRFTQAIANNDKTIPVIIEVRVGDNLIKGKGIKSAVEAGLSQNLTAEAKATTLNFQHLPTATKPTLPQAKIKPKATVKAEEGMKGLPKRVTPKVVKEFVGDKPAPFKKKRETTLLKDRIKNVARGYREGRTMTKNEIQNAQTEIIDILDNSRLERSDKAKFIHTIKNVQTTEQLKKALPVIQERVEVLAEQANKRMLIKEIQKEFKYTKPIKKGQKRVSKFDYQTNKLLENLRALNKLTQETAEIELNKIPQENLSETDKIKARLLSLKMNGAKASIVLHEQVLTDIRDLKRIGMEAKDEADFLKKVERQERIEEVLSGIEGQKESWKVLKGLKTAYVSIVANLFSTTNAVAGKDIADKYDYGMFQTNSRADFNRKTNEMADKVKEIYGIKKDKQLNKLFINELNNPEFTLIDNDGFKESISRFNLMNIYNGLKNDLIRERHYNAFGETQINSLLQNLTEEDIRLADEMMKEVQEYKEILNQRSIEITGRDMGSIENYWPSVSEHQAEFFDEIRMQGETPSARKERSANSKIIPKTANAWLVFQKHIAEAEHEKTVSRKYEELKNVFSDRRIEKTIKEKYGDKVYYALQNHIDTFSLNQRTEAVDVFSGVYNSALNNWVKAKIVAPTVFARQLISSVYSIEKVGIKNYIKYSGNPKEAFDFMWKNVPFVKDRFRSGYSEALEDVMRGANNLKIQTDGLTKYTTMLVRGGDIAGVVLNGYPIIQTELAKHGNMEKAIEVFQKFSEKTQQSPTKANLSQLQKQQNAFARTFMRFKNTTNQLLRLQVDANIQFINKQITTKQFATKTALYSIYTPMMYVLMGYAIKEGLKALAGKDDEEEKEELAGNILQNIIVQPFQAIPLLDAATETAYAEIRKRITGKTYYHGESLFSYPLLDDISTAWKKITKKEPSASDFLRIFSLIQEPITGLPTEMLLRYYGYVSEDKNKKSAYDEAVSAQKEKEKELKERMKPIYEEIQKVKENDRLEANRMYYKLSKEEKTAYKSIKRSEEVKNLSGREDEIYPIYLELTELKKTDRQEANKRYYKLSREDRKVYQKIKSKLE